MKDRDGREEQITGEASKAAYVATMSLIILLFFLSIFTFNVYRVPQNQAINDKTGVSSVTMKFNLLDEPKPTTNPETKMIFDSSDIPLSKTAILLNLLVWQLAAFNISARGELKSI